MAVIVLASPKSCGVTVSCLTLALASPRRTLLVDADPSGGTVRAGFLQGQLPPSIGLGALAAADREGPDALADAFEHNLRPLDAAGNRLLLAGLAGAHEAASLAETWPSLATLLRGMDQAGYDVVIDAGRLLVDAGRLHRLLYPAALLAAADVVLLVVTGWMDTLAAAQAPARILRAELEARGTGADALGLLLVSQGPHRPHQVSQAFGLPMLGALPWDPPAADHLAHGAPAPRSFTRSPLMRAARSTCEAIEQLAQRRQVRSGPAQPTSPAVTAVLQRIARSRGEAHA